MYFSMDEFIDEVYIARHEFRVKDEAAAAALSTEEADNKLREAGEAARRYLELRRRLKVYIGALEPGVTHEVLTRYFLMYQTNDTIAAALGCTVNEVEKIMEDGFQEIEAAYREGRFAGL